MGKLNIKIIYSEVGHARLSPKKNSFKYKVFFTKIPVTHDDTVVTPKLFSLNKWNILSVMYSDHGAKNDNTGWYEYITLELEKAKIKTKTTDKIYLCCFPRVFGYAFNPISYWLIETADGKLRAVMCEVRNTFKQNHNYLLSKPDKSFISFDDLLYADKKLFVSPFNKVEGRYEFKFKNTAHEFKSIINYYDGNGKHILKTFMGGNIETLTTTKILKSLVIYPAMTLLVVVRIHWQAIRLYFKKVKPTLKHRPKAYRNNQTSSSKK